MDFKKLQSAMLAWLKRRLKNDSFRQFESVYNSIRKGAEDWKIFSSFSAVPGYTGKNRLNPGENEKSEARNLRRGWLPDRWQADQLGRTLLVLGMAENNLKNFGDRLENLFVSSDLGEAVALYQSLPVLPQPLDLQARAAEGLRHNITTVFNAVALDNPYPADYLEDDAWNQMILKALFVDSPLYRIQGLEKRANPDLAHMLVEYAHERWSAGRTVSPELWRPVGPFIDDATVGDIERVLAGPGEIQKQAAALALLDAGSAGAKELLNEYRNILDTVTKGNITWDEIGRQVNKQLV
ncbi:MAG: EboA domain-containing protein [Balneolaceae bacterium]